MGPVKVREATEHDLDALIDLYGQLAEDRVESQPALPSTAASILTGILR